MGNAESSPGPHGGDGPRAYHYGAHRAAQPSARPTSSFLDEPVTRRATERGEAAVAVAVARPRPGAPPDDDAAPRSPPRLRYAATEMQGWRSHMEDRHLLDPPLASPQGGGRPEEARLLAGHHLFAVFDGHGGAFSSYFCGDHFVATLREQRAWRDYVQLLAAGSAAADPVASLALLKAALTAAFLALDAKVSTASRSV